MNDINKLLARKYPNIYQQLQKSIISNKFQLIVSNKNVKTVSFDNGKLSLLLNSKYNPEKEANDLVDNFKIDNLENVILLGMGGGYLVNALLKQLSSSSHLIIIEESIELFKIALEIGVIDDAIKSNRVHFIVGVNSSNIYNEFIKLGNIIFSLRTRIIQHPIRLKIDAEYFNNVKASFREFIATIGNTYKTKFKITSRVFRNTFKNLFKYIHNPGVNEIKKVIPPGLPAVIISAGPSLEEHIEKLKNINKHCVTFAVSTVLKKLLDNNIIPNFTILLDYHDLSIRYLDNLPSQLETILIADPAANSKAIDSFNGRVSFYRSNIGMCFLNNPLYDRGEVLESSTVAQTAFQIASYFESSPIFLIGQDLSYPRHITHIPGTSIYNSMMSKSSRFNTFADMEYEFILRYKEMLHKVKSVDGDELYTDVGMLRYFKEFDDIFANRDDIYNINSHGLKFTNARNIEINDLEHMVDKDTIPDIYSAISNIKSHTENSVKQLFDLRINEAGKVKDMYQQIYDNLNLITEKIAKNESPNSLIYLVKDLAEGVKNYREIAEIVRRMTPSDEMIKKFMDDQINSGSYSPVEKQKLELKRDITYINAQLNAVKDLLNILQEIS